MLTNEQHYFFFFGPIIREGINVQFLKPSVHSSSQANKQRTAVRLRYSCPIISIRLDRSFLFYFEEVAQLTFTGSSSFSPHLKHLSSTLLSFIGEATEAKLSGVWI